MHFKQIFAILIVASSFILPHTLQASDFEWRLSLNLRAHSDPYGYRYGLINRFSMSEPDIMLILDNVYEPADAYMVFRLAELCGRSPEYVLRIYHERRAYGWSDIASVLGIRSDRHDFIILREHHDMREVYYEYNNRRKERYEERYVPPVQHRYVPAPPRRDAPPPPKYKPQPQRQDQHRHEAPVVQERHQSKTQEPPKNAEPQRQDDRHDDNRKHR